jgi:hypothetical protein
MKAHQYFPSRLPAWLQVRYNAVSISGIYGTFIILLVGGIFALVTAYFYL